MGLPSPTGVYDKDVDDVVGYIASKDLFGLVLEHKDLAIDTVLRPPLFVPETQRAVDLLEEMQRRRTPLGIVVDEQGGMAGIVTLEDVLEELVGDIYSEHADVAQTPIKREEPGVALVSAAVPVRELNRELDLELPEDGDWTTLGGLCTALAGRIPSPGDTIEVPRGIRLEVVDASPRRVRSVRVRSLVRASRH